MRNHHAIIKIAASFADKLWPAAPQSSAEPFCAVVGLHSSGSSALAGVLYHLGAHLGRRLGGHYGRNPQMACGFEAAKLARLCEGAIPFPATRMVQPAHVVAANLGAWIRTTQAEAARLKTAAAGKYPMLCRMGPQLLDICGRNLRVIHIDRPLAESVTSIQRRCPQRSPEVLAKHQSWLWEGKRDLLAALPHEAVLAITYDRLLDDPRSVAQHVGDFMGLNPSAQQLDRAAATIDAGKRHIRAA